MAKLTNPNPTKKFSVNFDDTAEGRVRLFVNGKLDSEIHFDTYGQALRHIDSLRDKGWLPISPNVEAIEALLRTAELYHLKAEGSDGQSNP